MNKLIPFHQYAKKTDKFSFLSKTSVVVNEKGVPLGFIFGRDSFITFLEHFDSEFEKLVPDPKKAFNNPAGKLIDLIVEKLPLNPDFVRELKLSIKETKKTDWIPMEEVKRFLHV